MTSFEDISCINVHVCLRFNVLVVFISKMGSGFFISNLARNESLLKVISAYMVSYSCQIYNFISFCFSDI